MRLGVLAAGAIGGAALLLAVVGAPVSRHAEAPPAPIAAHPPSVAAGGVTLASAHVSLPDETEALPPGAHVDLVTARCTACHSAGMMLTQPPLSADQWKATVTKMRDVYKAPITPAEEPQIVAYLSGLRARP